LTSCYSIHLSLPSFLLRAEVKVREAGKGNVQTKTIEADFSATTAALFKKIETELSELDIAILVSVIMPFNSLLFESISLPQVNNVGASYPHAQFLDKLDDSLVDQLININVVTLTKLTKLVLPKMVEKKKGIIVNVGSAAGLVPIGTLSNPDFYFLLLLSGTRLHFLQVTLCTQFTLAPRPMLISFPSP